MEYIQNIKRYIEVEISVLEKLDLNKIEEALLLLKKTLDKEGNIFIFGNGGSSATASHFQNDFNRGISEYTDRKFRFQCLNDNTATIMAIANDFSFDEVFRMQLIGRIKENDIVIAISGSGNSRNVINAVKYAKEQKCKIIGLTGFDGGELKKVSDISLHVPVSSMQITEDIHMILDHLMMYVFCNAWGGLPLLK